MDAYEALQTIQRLARIALASEERLSPRCSQISNDVPLTASWS
jgi:hypothetical protein